MRILWLCNTYTPECSKEFNLSPAIFGGWLFDLSKKISENNRDELCYIFYCEELKSIECKRIDNITYYGIPLEGKTINNYNKNNEFILSEIISIINPDIIHVWGTEYTHSLSMVNVCIHKNIVDRLVLSIQGLVNIYAYHYLSADIVNVKRTFADIVLNDSLTKQKEGFEIRGKYEIEAISKCKNVIGRTDWDKACTSIINCDINYFFCNEILRNEFYESKKWNYENCNKHSILISNGSYPIKGLHVFLKALAIIIKYYPDVKVRICGSNIIPNKKYKYTSYQKIIANLIEKNNLNSNIEFIGALDAREMCEEYLMANIFVSPSMIENESNSLSEAKILGVPSVASYVGGVTNRIEQGIDGFLYQHDAPYMLAYYVMKLFEDIDLANSFSINSIKNAEKILDKEVNFNTLINIYRTIANK